MKKLVLLLPVLAIVWSCSNPGSGGAGASTFSGLNTFTDSASYAQGMMMGEQIASFQEDGDDPLISSAALKAGLDAAMSGSEGLLTEAELEPIMMQFQMKLQQASQKKAQAESAINAAEGASFLAENASKEGVITTESGLQYKVLKEGSGASPTAADKVEVDYEGKLLNGEVFDSSFKRGQHATFGVSQVIPGWTEGLQLMKEGSKFQFFIPSNLAYGERGSPPNIGPGATLIFEVELFKVNP